jgi:hypothetical protein
VVRVDLGLSPLDTLYAHDIDRFSGGDKVKGFLTANEENDLLKGYDALVKSGIDLIGKASPEVMDALNYIVPKLSFDIPDADSNDDEIATMLFAGIGRFAPGLMGVFKRGEKLPVVFANNTNEQVKQAKDKAFKGDDKASRPTPEQLQKMSNQKQFKSVVSLPPSYAESQRDAKPPPSYAESQKDKPPSYTESQKTQATKLFVNAKEIKPKLTASQTTFSSRCGEIMS